MAASIGLRFLTASLQSGDLSDYMAFGKLDHVFALDPGSTDVFEFVRAYVKKESSLPSIDLVEEELGLTLQKEEAGAKWLFDKLFATYVQRSLKLLVADAQEHFQEDPLKAMEVMVAGLSKLQSDRIAPKIVDFKQAGSQFWPQLSQKWASQESAVKFGWDYLDHQSGGILPGDLISLVGRPGLGKTWLLLWTALHVWRTTKKPVIFVSMEMGAGVIQERLAAIFTSTEMDFFKTGMSQSLFLKPGVKPTKAKVKEALQELEASDMPPFIVVDGNLTASVDDVVSLAQQYAPGAVFIDGAYMLSNEQSRNMYEAVAINCNMLKKNLATGLGIPTFCTWQFGREVTKLKKGEKPGLQHIGYSDVIGQASTIVLGLFQEDATDNVEQIMRRIVTVLKGRGGEVGEFATHWDFKGMNFAQIDIDMDFSTKFYD